MNQNYPGGISPDMARAMQNNPSAGPPRLTIMVGIDRVEELNKRLEDLRLQLDRILSRVGSQTNNTNQVPLPPTATPTPENMLWRLKSAADSNHRLLSQCCDLVGELETSLIG